MTYYGRVIDTRVSEIVMMKELVAALESRGVGFVYCTNAFLVFNIAFESRERVVCRWTYTGDRDRFMDYCGRVDAALAEGRPVALVGYYAQKEKDFVLDWLANRPDMQKNFRVISRRYFILFEPPVWILRNLDFRFTNEKR
jgi:hypothetical protein